MTTTLGAVRPCAACHHLTTEPHPDGCAACDELAQVGAYAPCQTVDLPAGAELADDLDTFADELVAEYAAAIERQRDRAQEARAGADYLRRINQPEASTWYDCARCNSDSIELMYYTGAAFTRKYRAERDARDNERSPYRPDDRPWPILAVARAELARRRAERLAAQ